jgi:hypothetical protein
MATPTRPPHKVPRDLLTGAPLAAGADVRKVPDWYHAYDTAHERRRRRAERQLWRDVLAQQGLPASTAQRAQRALEALHRAIDAPSDQKATTEDATSEHHEYL